MIYTFVVTVLHSYWEDETKFQSTHEPKKCIE